MSTAGSSNETFRISSIVTPERLEQCGIILDLDAMRSMYRRIMEGIMMLWMADRAGPMTAGLLVLGLGQTAITGDLNAQKASASVLTALSPLITGLLGKEVAARYLNQCANKYPTEAAAAFLDLLTLVRRGVGDTPEMRYQRFGPCLASVPPGLRRFCGKTFLRYAVTTSEATTYLQRVHSQAGKHSQALHEEEMRLRGLLLRRGGIVLGDEDVEDQHGVALHEDGRALLEEQIRHMERSLAEMQLSLTVTTGHVHCLEMQLRQALTAAPIPPHLRSAVHYGDIVHPETF